MQDPLQAYPAVMERLAGLSDLRADGYRYFLCPAHADHVPSAYAFVHPESGALVLRCRRGCPQAAIANSLGLSAIQFLPGPKKKLKWRREGVYAYRDPGGGNVFRVVRLSGWDGATRVAKKFLRERWEAGRWETGADGVLQPVYRLPEILKSSPDAPLILVEGEKCADAVAALGFQSTTFAGGANCVPDDTHKPVFHNRRVILARDNDADGLRWGQRLLHWLVNVPCRKVVLLDPDQAKPSGYDLADWVDDTRPLGRERMRKLLSWMVACSRKITVQ